MVTYRSVRISAQSLDFGDVYGLAKKSLEDKARTFLDHYDVSTAGISICKEGRVYHINNQFGHNSRFNNISKRRGWSGGELKNVSGSSSNGFQAKIKIGSIEYIVDL